MTYLSAFRQRQFIGFSCCKKINYEVKNMKKIIAISIVSLLAVSVLIFPAVAAVTANGATWNAYPEWLNQYRVRGYVEITEYSGPIPTAYFEGTTNSGIEFNTQRTGIGYNVSNYVDCDLSGSLPLATYRKYLIQ